MREMTFDELQQVEGGAGTATGIAGSLVAAGSGWASGAIAGAVWGARTGTVVGIAAGVVIGIAWTLATE